MELSCSRRGCERDRWWMGAGVVGLGLWLMMPTGRRMGAWSGRWGWGAAATQHDRLIELLIGVARLGLEHFACNCCNTPSMPGNSQHRLSQFVVFRAEFGEGGQPCDLSTGFESHIDHGSVIQLSRKPQSRMLRIRSAVNSKHFLLASGHCASHTARRLRVAMCTIEHSVTVSMGGKCTWKVKPCDLVTVDGQSFVKLKPHDYGFIRLVCEGALSKLPANPTLAGCDGYIQLVKNRNEQQAAALTSNAGAESLFGPQADPPAAKRQRISAANRKQMKDSPTTVAVPAPGPDGEKMIDMVRPAHPCEHVCVPLNPEVVSHVVGFIRSKVDVEALTHKRNYRSDDLPKGVWKTKAGTFVVKCDPESTGQKFRRAKSLSQAVAVSSCAREPTSVTTNEGRDDDASGQPDEEGDANNEDPAVS